MILTAAFASGCVPNRQHRTSSGRRLSAPHEYGRTWCNAGSSARTQHGSPQCFRTSLRDCHLGQRGCAAARGDRVFACESGKLAPCGTGALSNSLSPMGANGRGVITAVSTRSAARWSILLTH